MLPSPMAAPAATKIKVSLDDIKLDSDLDVDGTDGFNGVSNPRLVDFNTLSYLHILLRF